MKVSSLCISNLACVRNISTVFLENVKNKIVFAITSDHLIFIDCGILFIYLFVIQKTHKKKKKKVY